MVRHRRQWAAGMSRQQRQNAATGGLSLADCPRFAMLRAARRFNSRGTGAKGACPGLGPRRMQKSSLSPSPRGCLLTPRSNDGDSQRVTVPVAAGSAAASTAGGTGAKCCLSRVGTAADAEIVAVTVAARVFADAAVQRRGQSASDSPRCCGQRGSFNSRGTGAKVPVPGWDRGGCRDRCCGRGGCTDRCVTVAARFLLTPRSNDGDSQRVTVPIAAGSAAASTAGGLAPKVPVPGWTAADAESVLSRSPRGFLLTRGPTTGTAASSPTIPKSRQTVTCRDWPRCLSRAGTAADAESVAVTVAARVFADAAVQRRGQSASDSPRCCGQRGGFNSRGTGAKGACPGPAASASDSPLAAAARRLQQQGDAKGLSRAGTAADAESVAVTVAARVFADAAVQRRGQARRASPTTSEVAGRCMQGLAPQVPVPGWDRGGCRERCCHGRRAVFCGRRGPTTGTVSK